MTAGQHFGPQPGPQTALLKCSYPMIFFGGARGGGKTFGMILRLHKRARRYGPAFNALAVRRSTVSFEDAVDTARQILVPLGWRFSMAGNRPLFTSPWGGKIRFSYLERIADTDQYQGRNLTDVWVEEVGQYAQPDPIDRLFAALRSAAGVPVSMVLTGNPGGPGQGWIRDRFDLVPFPLSPQVVSVKINEMTIDAAVIPSRIQDNKLLLRSDPTYIERLKGSGSKELIKAWLEGDWNAVEGAFFDGWDTAKHVIDPFEIPKDWLRFRSMDWGFAAPFSVGWWAVAGDDYGDIPRGCLIRYREWYGATGPNKGMRLDIEQVSAGIKIRSADERIAYTVADPAMWSSQSGPSIAERLMMDGVPCRPGDNARVARGGAIGGWDQMRSRLRGDDGGRPMLVVFRTCRDFIRTVPTLQHDPDKAEDLDTASEDHVADEARYACMSRPYVKAQSAQKPERSISIESGADGEVRVLLDPRKLIEDATRARG